MWTFICIFLLGGAFMASGCMSAVNLAEVTEGGGVVTYPLKKDKDSIYSPFRADALNLIEEQCHGAYRIVKEGETQGVTRNSGLDADDLISTRRYWGLRFRCK